MNVLLALLWLGVLDPSTPGASTPAEDGDVAQAVQAPGTAAEEAAGPTPEPAPESPAEDSLASLLEQPVAPGEVGSFGYRLQQARAAIYFHGYATAEFYKQQGRPSTFELHYFNLFAGANVADTLFAEAQLEYEHGGAEVALRYGYVDYRVSPALITRVGLFLVPFGQYNEFLYPEYLSLTPRAPMVLTHSRLIPVVWSDVGLQLRGSLPLGEALEVNYAAYVSNGLEQRPAAGAPAGSVPEGGGLRGMRANMVERFDSNKAVGGRLGLRFQERVNVGASAYHGAYTLNGQLGLTLLGADASFHLDRLTGLFEFAYGLQDLTGRPPRQMWGYFTYLGYSVLPWLEPVVALDRLVLGGPTNNLTRVSLGVNLRPLEQYRDNFVIHAFVSPTHNSGVDVPDDLLIVQASLGF